MDDDLNSMSPEQLVAEVKRLRHAIRAHRPTRVDLRHASIREAASGGSSFTT